MESQSAGGNDSRDDGAPVGRVDMQAGSDDRLARAPIAVRVGAVVMAVGIMAGALLIILRHVFTG